ncbi:MAG TPA: HNH endonuclease [Amycolatopsis sp.]|nr:HNH endonuclease [Amycolatopsis sp.]
MPWARLDDRMAMSVKVRGLADQGATGDKATDQRNAALGHFMQLLTWASGERSDGFVTVDIVDLFGTAASTKRLLRAKYGRAPLLHQLDENGNPPECPCLDGREWKADFEYLIHDFLDRNPSRAENDVHKAKNRELRDPKLKEAVRVRDADTCRYCGKFCKFSDRVSDDGLTYDHVDPEVANGMANLVIACRGCNRRKGRRTPTQADMILRDLPTTGPVTDSSPDASPDTGPDATHDTATAATLDGTNVHEHPAEHGTTTPANQRRDSISSQNHGSPGRDGAGHDVGTGSPSFVEPPSIPLGPPPPRFTGREPSPYLRESRPFPEFHAGRPPQPDDNPLPRKENTP